MTYDSNNIFAKILRGEIPNDTVFEDEHVLAFRDITPQAPAHVLVIPKGAYTDMDDFAAHASDAETLALTRAIGKVARVLGIAEAGYRVISNCRSDGRQEVPHLHFHVVGGKMLGRFLPRD